MNRFSSLGVPTGGNLLVEASAGTGKTYALTTLFVRLILERGLAVDEILVVTFTEAATAELRGRIRGRLRAAVRAFEAHLEGSGPGDDVELAALAAASDDPARDRQRLALALSEVDEAAVSTIHGFCHRVLTETAFESGSELDLELVTDVQSLRDEVLFDFWSRSLVEADPEEVSALRERGVRPSTCRRLVDAVLRSPDLRVLPEAMARPVRPRTEPMERARRAMADAWDRRALETLLLDGDALKGNLYRRDHVPKWLAEAEAFLLREDGWPDPGETWLTKLSADVIAGATKKGKEGRHPRQPFFEACQALRVEVQRRAAWATDYAIWLRRRLADEVRETLPTRKRELGIMSFDDLLLRVDDALASSAGPRLAKAVRRRHPVALVDEFQDTDPVQYRIFSRIWPEGTRFFIGDPKQAIYAFRGADIFAYMRAAEAIEPDRRYTMGVNWRSDPSLIAAVAALFGYPETPFVTEGITFPHVEPRPGAEDAFDPGSAAEIIGRASLSFRFVAREQGGKMAAGRAGEIADAIAAEIAALLASDATVDGRPMTPADVAVLTRKNREAFEVQRALRRLRVPSVVLGDQSVFEEDHPEAGELQRVLAAVAEPTQSPTVRAALCTDLLGLSARDLEAIDRDEADGEGSWESWVGRFRSLNVIWSQRGFIQMMRALLERADVERRLLALDDGERRLTNLRHLIELLHTTAVTEHLGPSALLQWLATQRAPENARVRSEASQVRLESDDRAVKITTVHRSKGLEYPVVYCPYLWDGRLLFNQELSALELHRGKEAVIDLAPDEGGESRRQAERERLAENARLLYVALTRAKHRCVVVWGGLPRYETSALGYLLHAPSVGGSVEEVAQHLKGLDDDALHEGLCAVVARSEGAAEVRPLGDPRGRPLPVTAQATVKLTARRVSPSVARWWRTASFSELSARSGGRALDEGRDRDEIQGVPLPQLPGGSERGEIITLVDFPQGAVAGTFFHAVLERLDFARESGPEREDLLRRMLRAYGFDRAAEDPDAMRRVVGRALDEVLQTPLEPGDDQRRFRLADLPWSQRLDELEFFLPVASVAGRHVVPRGTQLSLLFPDDRPPPGAAVPVGRVTAEKLAAVFADHPSATLDPRYAERVARLDFLPLEGFLKGFIDLVMVVDDRWYVVDYKTNHLGDRMGDYAVERLPAAMAHGHYYLQSHLYALAVHRHLSRRLPSYRYADDFGGVFYLFLKGMRPTTGSQTGVFFDKPPLGRIEALSDLLDRPMGGER